MARSSDLRLLVASLLTSGCVYDLDAVQRSGRDGPPSADAGDNLDGPPADAPSCPDNLVTNGDFEAGLSGWGPVDAEVSRYLGGHSGAYALKVSRDIPPEDPFYILTDEPDSVIPPSPGSYTGQAWIRVDDGSDQEIELAVRERDGTGSTVDESSSRVTADASWQLLSATYPVMNAGVGSVELYLAAITTQDGVSFLIDDVCLRHMPP